MTGNPIIWSDRGPQIATWSGRRVHPFTIRPDEVCIDDIAHSLGRICRYGGHVREFYSVAEHSVYVSHAVPEEHALAGLLHDAAEAFIGDVPSPVKYALESSYVLLEQQIQAVVFPKFGLPEILPDVVCLADMAILRDEMEQLSVRPLVEWEAPMPGLGVTIECWGPEKAPQEFIKRFYELVPAEVTA